jgi:hypothetical protein
VVQTCSKCPTSTDWESPVAELVKMVHPDLPHTAVGEENPDPGGPDWGPVEVTKAAFDDAYRRLGWVEADYEEGIVASEPVGEQPGDPAQLSSDAVVVEPEIAAPKAARRSNSGEKE